MRPLLAFALLTTVAFGAEPDNPVVAAAKKRQEAIRSVEFVGRVKEVVEPGGNSLSLPRPGTRGRPSPSERVTLEYTFRFILDGDRYCMEVGKNPITPHIEGRHLRVCDGKVCKVLRGPATAMTWQNSTAVIGQATRKDLRTDAETTFAPIFFTCCGLGDPTRNPGIDPTPLAPTGATLKIDGTETVEYTRTTSHRLRPLSCWVDPAQDHVIRRMKRDHANFELPMKQHDVRYAKHEPFGLWLPREWEYSSPFEDGSPRQTTSVTVDKVVVNGTWPDEEFDLKFPPGVRVVDARNDTAYLVLDDGSFRPFQFGVDDAEPAEQSPTTPPPNWFVANAPWLVSVVLVVAVVALLVARRVWRKKTTQAA